MHDEASMLVDDSDASHIAKDHFVSNADSNFTEIKIDLENLAYCENIIANLSGRVVCLLGYGAFGIERNLLLHFMNKNKQITPYPVYDEYKHLNIGKWSWLAKNISLDESVKIGVMTTILGGARISHSTRIGNFCWIGEDVYMGQKVHIRKNSVIHNGVRIRISACVGPYAEIRTDKNAYTKTSEVIETDFYSATAKLVKST